MLIRIVTFALACVMAAPLAAAELLMFKDDACMWCARWDAEVGPDYPSSTAAATAPLRRVDLRRDPLPDDLVLESRVRYTPTFVLVEDNREVGRITGYPGAGEFWLQLDRLMENLETTDAPDVDPDERAGAERAGAGQPKPAG